MAGKRGQRSKKLAVIDRKRSRALKRGLDGRTRAVKHLAATYNALCADLGGEPGMSIQQRTLAKRAAWLVARLDHLESVALEAGEFTDEADRSYAALVNTLNGVFGKLGVERKAAPAEDLHKYMAAKPAKAGP